MDEALDWFVRLEASPGDEELLRKFNLWYGQCPENQEAYESISAVWASPDFAAALKGHDERAGQRGAHRPRHRASVRRRATQWIVSAAALLLVGAYLYPAVLIQLEADYATSTGQQQLVSLPDGSSAFLNTSSAIAVDFSDGKRNVRLLQGEAFFDVIHDPNHPFIVAGRYGEAQVKGTAFAVETASDMDRVILERGRVEVRRPQDLTAAVELAPDEMVSAFADRLSAIEKADVPDALAWRNGRINFAGEKLGNVVTTLRRYYRGVIIVASARAGETRVSGSIRIDDPETALRSLAESASASLTRLPGGIMVLR